MYWVACCRFMPGKEGPFFKKTAADQGNYLETYGKEPCIEVGTVREFQVCLIWCRGAMCTMAFRSNQG